MGRDLPSGLRQTGTAAGAPPRRGCWPLTLLAVLALAGSPLAAAAASAQASAPVLIPCSPAALADAISSANAAGGGALSLTPGCTYTYSSPADPASGTALPAISTAISINASGDIIARDTSAGVPQFGVIAVVAGGSLTLSAATVTGGDTQKGGGIAVEGGAATLNADRITGNTAAQGGGIESELSSVTLNSTTVDRNTAAIGGGISVVAGTTALHASAVVQNRATGTGPDVTGGGGMAFFGFGAWTVQSSLIAGNTAEHDGGGILNVSSGGSITGTVITKNTARTGDGGGLRGGGLAVFTITDTLITKNTAVDGGGIFQDLQGGPVNLTRTATVFNTPNNCAPPGTVPGCTA
jgi:hypothetical protein